jgi:multidrug resistance efflux pump
MDEITVVRKRSRLWPALLAILLVVAIVLVVLWLMGTNTPTTADVSELFELAGRVTSGTA